MSGFLCSMVGATFTVAAAAEVLRSKKGITAVGNAQVDTAQSQFGGASALFDGTGDYLAVENIAGGITEDQTFEFWIRFADLPASSAFRMVAGDGSSTRYLGVLNDSGTYRWEVSFASGQYVERFTTTLSTGVWYHVALTKSGSTLKMYQAGTALTSAVSFNTMTAAKTLFISGTNYIGSWNTSSNFFNGHMDEIRVSNNVRYTTTFTPSTSPFVNDANTVLLIHANGTDASTFFEDDNGVRNKKGISAIGNAQIDTAQSKFGGASLLLDGTGDALSTAGIAFGTDAFTVEYWIRPTAQSSYDIHWDLRGTPTSNLSPIVYTLNGTLYVDVGATTVITGSALSNNTWYHIALARSGSSTKLFVDGTQVGSTYTDSNNYVSAATLYIGELYSLGGNGVVGNMDEFRISNSARYTAGFTPSTTAFVNDANTLLLMHMNQSDAATIFTDDNSGTVTTEDSYTVPTAAFTSDALTVALYHFENNGTDSGPNGYTLDVTGGYSSSVVKFGTYSGNLSDSTSDYFSHTTNRQWSPYNGSIVTDWTCEGYFYYTSWTGAAQDFNGVPLPNAIWIADVGGNRLPVLFGFTGSAHSPAGRLTMAVSKYSGGGGDPRDIVATSTTTYDLNTWHHIALTYNSTTGIFKGYINGAKAFTSSVPYGDLYTLPTHLTIGGGNAANSECYVDEVRISRMIRYGI